MPKTVSIALHTKTIARAPADVTFADTGRSGTITVVPTVSSRYPFWENRLTAHARTVPGHGYGYGYDRRREPLGTSAPMTEPDVAREKPEGTFGPLALVVAAIFIICGLLARFWWAAGAMVLASTAFIVYWLWPRSVLGRDGPTLSKSESKPHIPTPNAMSYRLVKNRSDRPHTIPTGIVRIAMEVLMTMQRNSPSSPHKDVPSGIPPAFLWIVAVLSVVTVSCMGAAVTYSIWGHWFH